LVARLTARVLAGLLGLLLVQCSLTIDEEALGGEHRLDCASDQKECEVQGVPTCVGLRDPRFGCGQESCIPCNLPNATAVCSGSYECVKASCHPAWEDCNEKASDGCEAPLNRDVANCGECGTVCKPQEHADDVKCGTGHCYIRQCDDGYLDCNRDFEDGCEIAKNDPENCGECGEPCGGVCCAFQCCDGVCLEQACPE